MKCLTTLMGTLIRVTMKSPTYSGAASARGRQRKTEARIWLAVALSTLRSSTGSVLSRPSARPPFVHAYAARRRNVGSPRVARMVQ
jgi:hypothetical protein